MHIPQLVPLVFLAAFTTASTSPITYADRKCGDDLSNLWLDVVLVIDNSRAVTNMDKVTKSILAVFVNETRIGTRQNEPRTTRIGVVSYNRDAEIVADLDRFQSFADLSNSISENFRISSSSNSSSLLKGLEGAEKVLSKTLNTGERDNYRKVFIVYTSVVDGLLTSVPLADRLKADGVTIITVDVNEKSDESVSNVLGDVATKNYDFSMRDSKLVDRIQEALLQTNCFCPNRWTQLRASHGDNHSYRYGTCLVMNTLAATWRAARLSCRNQWKNAHLANEYEVNKHNYILEMARSTRQSYHIGLSYSSGAWFWEQPIGKPLKRAEWTNWMSGYPLVSSTMSVGFNVANGSETRWQNTGPMTASALYACEVVTCDTDNYCESLTN